MISSGKIDKTGTAERRELQVVVTVALCGYRKTFSLLKNSFAARKDNREPAKVRGKLLVILEYPQFGILKLQSVKISRDFLDHLVQCKIYRTHTMK